MRAKPDSLTPVLRDLYLIIDEENIPFEKLASCLSHTESPTSVILWCILFLCKKLEHVSFKAVRNNAVLEAGPARRMWELVSKVCYANVYRYTSLTESKRERNRLQKCYGNAYRTRWEVTA